jgi:hypothetical protein
MPELFPQLAGHFFNSNKLQSESRLSCIAAVSPVKVEGSVTGLDSKFIVHLREGKTQILMDNHGWRGHKNAEKIGRLIEEHDGGR